MDLGQTAAQILGFSVTSGVVTFGLNWGLSSYRERAARNLETEHMALRVALAFEKFAIDCGTLLSEAGTYQASSGSAGAPISELPEIRLPTRIDWKRLDHAITNRALSFENLIKYGNGAIDFESGYSDPDEPLEQGLLQAGRCGHRAVLLAEELRAMHNLPAAELPSSVWDFRKFLKEQHDKYEAQVAEYNE